MCSVRMLEPLYRKQKAPKKVTWHIWETYLEIAEDYRYGIGNKELYKERS